MLQNLLVTLLVTRWTPNSKLQTLILKPNFLITFPIETHCKMLQNLLVTLLFTRWTPNSKLQTLILIKTRFSYYIPY